jgi:uncharacterized protein
MVADNTRRDLIVDADAHVVESERTWDFMDPADKKYRPVSLQAPEQNGMTQQFWLINGKIGEQRLPAFSNSALEKASKQAGRKFADSQESRELENVDLRLKYMDETEVDIQVLHNTMFIFSVGDQAAAEVALYKGWNRWLADIWRQ